MPFTAPKLASIDTHLRDNIARNHIADIEIVTRLRAKGYKRPEQYLDRFKAGQALATDKLVFAVHDIIDQQDAALQKAKQ